jgi:hypothetical protein
MKIIIEVIERRLNRRFKKSGGSICCEGEKVIKFFKKDYPNGVNLTRPEFQKFINKHKLTQFDVGLICNELFSIHNYQAKADTIDLDFYWAGESRQVMLNAFFKLAKNTKLLK